MGKIIKIRLWLASGTAYITVFKPKAGEHYQPHPEDHIFVYDVWEGILL
jgi:hypothetical protein